MTQTEESTYYRRRLPHYELAGSTYFITFRTVPGLLLPDHAKDIVLDSVKFHVDDKYRLYACVVMETHVHSILQPLPLPTAKGPTAGTQMPRTLSRVCHSIKSYSAHTINSILTRTGGVWQSESYDWVIRDDKDYREKVTYVMWNPVKAGLVERPEQYRWLFVAL